MNPKNKAKSGRTLSRGYVILVDGENRKREHIQVAETAIRKPLPVGAVVHHHDENGSNNSNSNLVICENGAYHRLIHRRMRVLALGGDPESQKICSACRRLLLFADFHKGKSGTVGIQGICRECVRGYHKTRYQAQKSQSVTP